MPNKFNEGPIFFPIISQLLAAFVYVIKHISIYLKILNQIFVLQ